MCDSCRIYNNNYNDDDNYNTYAYDYNVAYYMYSAQCSNIKKFTLRGLASVSYTHLTLPTILRV